MYAPFFGLDKEPFSIAPDPHFLFMSDMHREALAHLLYGVAGGGGFVLLTGEIGAGKTTVCRAFLDQVPANCVVAYIFNPRLTVIELLQTVREEFRIPKTRPTLGNAAPSVKDHVDALNAFLLAAYAGGRHAVLIIDEAQSLSLDVLEQLRLLTNLETAERKLLQIVLIGQPELRDMLARPELEQLAQRVIARYHLPALSGGETAQYIQHRLAVAGPTARAPFDKRAVARIHALTGGVPRRINLLCDRALLGAYAHGQHEVGVATVERAAREVFGPLRPPRHAGPNRRKPSLQGPSVVLGGLAGGAMVLGLVMLLAWLWRDGVPRLGKTGGSQPLAAAASVASVPPVPSVASVASGASGAPAASPAPAARSAAALGAAPVSASVAVSSSAAPAAAAAQNAGASAAATAPATVGAVLAGAHRDEATAWRDLAPAWQAQLSADDPCAQTATSGLACFRSAGGLTALRQLRRPAVLVLRDESGQPAYVRLLSLGAGQATLAAGASRWQLPLPMLARAWRGEFLTFWRAPAGWRDGSELSGTAAGRSWLQQRLTAAGADDAGLPTRERVRAFQVANGLQADGLAGPMTVMLLGSADEPRLPLER